MGCGTSESLRNLEKGEKKAKPKKQGVLRRYSKSLAWDDQQQKNGGVKRGEERGIKEQKRKASKKGGGNQSRGGSRKRLVLRLRNGKGEGVVNQEERIQKDAVSKIQKSRGLQKEKTERNNSDCWKPQVEEKCASKRVNRPKIVGGGRKRKRKGGQRTEKAAKQTIANSSMTSILRN